MNALEEYLLNLSLFSPYVRCDCIPFYLNPNKINAILEAGNFLKNYENLCGRQNNQDDHDFIRAYKKSRLVKRPTHVSSNPLELIKNTMVVSHLEADSPQSNLMLPIERFFGGGNAGSGRHVRFANLELKGSGRNRLAVRDDWTHGWGGASLDETVSEIIISELVSALCPLGAVSPIYGSFYKHGRSPAVLVQKTEERGDPKHILLSVLARELGYTRLANLYFSPEVTSLPKFALPSLDQILDQYAALTAYGFFHLMPTEDNLTLEGKLLDLTSLFSVSRDHLPSTLVVVFPKWRHSITKRTKIDKFLPEINEPLRHCCSSAAYLHAIKRIAAVREKLWQENLPYNWEEKYLEKIAFYWLMRKGFEQDFCAEQAVHLTHCFSSQFEAEDRTPENYFSRSNLKIAEIEQRNDSAVVEIKQDCSNELGLLQIFLNNNQKRLKHTLSAYNQIRSGSSWGLNNPRQYLKEPLNIFNNLNFNINKTIMHGRFANMYSFAHKDQPLMVHATDQTVEIAIPKAYKYAFAQHNMKTMQCLLSVNFIGKKGKLERKLLPLRSSGKDIFYFGRKALPQQLILEGFILKSTDNTKHCLPIPITFVD